MSSDSQFFTLLLCTVSQQYVQTSLITMYTRDCKLDPIPNHTNLVNTVSFFKIHLNIIPIYACISQMVSFLQVNWLNLHVPDCGAQCTLGHLVSPLSTNTEHIYVERLKNKLVLTLNIKDKIKDNMVDRTCGTREGEKKCIQNFRH